MEDSKRQCAHATCECNVLGEDIYCSTHCKRADETQREESHCACGHRECADT